MNALASQLNSVATGSTAVTGEVVNWDAWDTLKFYIWVIIVLSLAGIFLTFILRK